MQRKSGLRIYFPASNYVILSNKVVFTYIWIDVVYSCK